MFRPGPYYIFPSWYYTLKGKLRLRREQQERERQEQNRKDALAAAERAKLPLPPRPTTAEFTREIAGRFPPSEVLQKIIELIGIAYEDFDPPPRIAPALHNPYAKLADLFSAGITELIRRQPAIIPKPADGLVYLRPVILDQNTLKALAEPFYQPAKHPLALYFRNHTDWDLERESGVDQVFYMAGRLSDKSFERYARDHEKLWFDMLDELGPIQHAVIMSPYFRLYEKLPTTAHVPEPYAVPVEPRFTGAWMLAPPGAGKTTALRYLIDKDLDAVYHDLATVVVMDSTGIAEQSLLHYLSHLKDFAPGGALHGKLILLEPHPEFPLALNLFDIGQDRIDELSPEEREIALNTAQEMMEFILGGLLGAEMTKKQGGVFRYLIQALMVIPNATIFTLAELMEPEGYEKHRPHILKLDQWTRDFFEKRFKQIPRTKNAFAGTKQELYWRIDSILSDLTFRRMLSHPRNKLDLYTELQSSKVILINTNRALLKEERVETLGRYFIASIMQAIEQRALIDKSKRKPVFIYLDEAHEYIAREPKIANLLNTVARKNNVAFLFAHQGSYQIKEPQVLQALSDVGVRYGSRNENDAKFVANLLKTTPEALLNHPRGVFTTYVRDHTTQGVVIRFPPMDNPSLMTDAEFETIRTDMRSRFSATAIDVPMPPRPEDIPATQPVDGEEL